MGTETGIERTDHTFNPWRGCSRASGAYLHQPFAWDRAALKAGVVRRVFCASLADWLDDEVPLVWLADLIETIRGTPNLRWLLLTKRPQNWHRAVRALQIGRLQAPPVNATFGFSAGSQATFDKFHPDAERASRQLRMPLFLSAEPLLGPLDVSAALGRAWGPDSHGRTGRDSGIDWVIVGGESGPGARPMHPAWARSIRDQCRDAGVPFFFKQWGEWAPPSAYGGDPYRELFTIQRRGADACREFGVVRVGKKVAGAVLDGREWREFPR